MSADVWRFVRRKLAKGVNAVVVHDTGEMPLVVIDQDAAPNCIAHIKAEPDEHSGRSAAWVWLPGLQGIVETARRALADGIVAPVATAATAAIVTASTVGAVGISAAHLAPPITYTPVAADRPALIPVTRWQLPDVPRWAGDPVTAQAVRQNEIGTATPTPKATPSASPSPSSSAAATPSASPTVSPSPSHTHSLDHHWRPSWVHTFAPQPDPDTATLEPQLLPEPSPTPEVANTEPAGSEPTP